jgi:hypothetical protein
VSYLSDPDRLERLARYVMDVPMNAPSGDIRDSLNDAAARIRGQQERLAEYAAAQEPECVLPTRKTGVIVGMTPAIGDDALSNISRELKAKFPGVTLTVVTGAQSVAFEWVEA